MTRFTRITLDPGDPKVRRALHNRNAMHAIIAASTTGEDGRYLWRVDNDRVYLVSTMIDETRLQARLGKPVIETTDYQPFLDKLAEGREYAFTIEANPVTTHEGHRIPIRKPSERIDWITRQLTKVGCRNIKTMIESVHVDQFRKNDADRTTVTLQAVRYQGRLTVADPDELAHALTEGIGPAKAYGLGLLTLR